jgi:DUF2934 family protein
MQNAMATKRERITEGGRPVEIEVMPELQSRIAMRAYEIYEESGYVPGRDLENWLRAEQEVLIDDLG